MSNSYRDLIVWQRAVSAVTKLYRASESFPKFELYGLTSQVRRAAVSVACNIAEGQGRKSNGEFQQFLGNAKGSLLEVETQLLMSKNLQYLSEANFKELSADYEEISRLLNGLMNSLRKPQARARN
jgi:four helix bundle protein